MMDGDTIDVGSAAVMSTAFRAPISVLMSSGEPSYSDLGSLWSLWTV